MLVRDDEGDCVSQFVSITVLKERQQRGLVYFLPFVLPPA